MQLSERIRKNARRIARWFPAHFWLCYRGYMRLQKRRARGLYPPGAKALRSRGEHRAISVCDSRIRGGGGGWADRLQGILSVYGICREHDWRFGLWFKTPFVLEEYLIPNRYDWRIDERQLDRQHADVAVCSWLAPGSERFEKRYLQERIARHAVSHLYTNVNVLPDSRAAGLFDELFRPAPTLEALIAHHAAAIGGKYVAAAFRFLRLLGDFEERESFEVLSEERRETLIAQCLAQLGRLRAEHPQAAKVLVTADSSTFLRRAAAAFDWVYVVEGSVAHIDAAAGADDAVTMKMFLDFHLLAHASRVCLLVGKGMYRSGFSRMAARVGNVPFEQRIFR